MRNASFATLDLGGRLEESCPAAKLSKIPSRTHSGKREEEKPQKRRKEKGLLHQPGGAVCQGFAGENYARRASFSTGKRRSRLTLTGQRRQATFAGVFVFGCGKNSKQILVKLFFLCGSPTGLKLCKFSQNPEDICLRLEVKPEILCRPNLLKAL